MIKLSDIDFKSIDFINTSFREYLGIYKDYLISVAPCGIIIYNIKTPTTLNYTDNKRNKSLTYQDYKLSMIPIVRYHHNDTNIKRGCDVDPCDIFELVSGTYIHTKNNNDDLHLMGLDHSSDINKFDAMMLAYFRNIKIKQIT